MKKLFLIFTLIVISASSASASIMKVVSMNDFTTLDKSAEIKVYVAQDCYLHKNLIIPEGSVLVGSISEIKDPKRLKRDADFDFMVCYYMDNSKNKYRINLPLCGNYTKALDIDEKKVAKSAAISGTGKIVPGLNYAIYAAEGAKKHKGRRVKGAAKNIYDHSLLSMGKRGSHIRIQRGNCFCLKFPSYDEEEYTYQTLLTPIDKYGNEVKNHEIDRFLNPSTVEGSKLESNYPYKNQINKRVYYIAHPSKKERKKATEKE